MFGNREISAKPFSGIVGPTVFLNHQNLREARSSPQLRAQRLAQKNDPQLGKLTSEERHLAVKPAIIKTKLDMF